MCTLPDFRKIAFQFPCLGQRAQSLRAIPARKFAETMPAIPMMKVKRMGGLVGNP